MIKIELKNFKISNDLPFVLITGPCVIENESHSLFMAEKINKICDKLKINFVYKSSFDKANRSNIESRRGVDIKEAIKIFLASFMPTPLLLSMFDLLALSKLDL